MKKNYAAVITGLLLLIFCGDVFGQQTLVSDANKKALTDIATKKASEYATTHQKAVALAVSHKWPVRKKAKNGGLISLQGVNSLGFPVFLKTNDNGNIISAGTTRTNTLWPGGTLGLNLSGSSASLNNKLGIWDGGAVYTKHQEFDGKTITLHTTQSYIDHATHVAGTMIAKGVYPPAKGMSFGATTLQSYDFDDDITTMSSAASGLLLSNHSYGDVAGWDLDETGTTWTWYGLPGDTVDYTFGIYNTRTQDYDQIAYNAPHYLIVESAGNARGYPGPSVGDTYLGYKSRTNSALIQKKLKASDNISTQQWYDGISSTGNAKNILTVGAVGPLPSGPNSSSDIQIAYFSSWGPTDDGRVKPDIVGMGVGVLSTGSASPTNYIVLDGTSMSSPNVTGSLYLLQEYYAQKNSGNFMLAATLKGLACATADDAGNTGPDYIYGWGLLDMQKAAQAITNNGTKSIIKENTLSQGQTQATQVTASGNGPLMATISWTDPAGTPTADGTINDRTIKLVNDLDIRVSDGTTTYLPWILDPLHPAAAATTGDNIRDNVEQVYMPNAVPGKIYTITVSHKGTLKSGSQAYSLIATGLGGTAYCASGPASSADSRINNVKLSNINNTQTSGCTTYSDFTSKTVNLEQGKTYPLSLTLGTCGANFNKAAKVYIDWNGDGDFTDAGELVATSNIINGTGTFTTNITVPISVIPGNYSLMRVVLTETSDTSAITPCGTYVKGETQDYRVQFLKTSTDAGVTAIVSPDSVGACSGVTPVIVTLKNFGSAAISNIPVQVTIKAPDNSITTLNETYTGTLQPLEEENFTLTGTFTAAASSAYTITATTNLANDVITTNNQLAETITTNPAAVISAATANYCDETSQYILTGTGDGEILWYPTATASAPVAFGSPVETAQAPTANTYYAGLNDFSGSVGPAAKTAFSAGGYNQFGPSVYVHAGAPVVIQSARLYIGYPGQITFSVSNSDGETVSSTTINAVATRTSPGAGAQNDDPNDQGKVYDLNLQLPAAGDYTITTTFDANATLFRNNGGVTGYPFTVGNGLFSITGNNATDPDGSNSNYYQSFYYYFYDMQVKSLGCPSAARLAVPVVRPIITQSGTTLSSNFTTGNQWYENGGIVSGATDQTYTPTTSGKFKLLVTLGTGCTDTSASFVYVVPPKIGDNDISLAEYPVPANDKLNIIFTAKENTDLSISLINALGRTVFSNKQDVAAGNFSTVLNVASLPAGTYVIKLVLGGKVYANKIIIRR
jgi:hypothetical protein